MNENNERVVEVIKATLKEKNEYIKAIRLMLKVKGLKETNYANHRMLEIGAIPMEYFQAAARVLAKAIIK